MDEQCTDVHRLYSCYRLGQALQTPSPHIGKKVRKHASSPGRQGQPASLHSLSPVTSPQTPQQSAASELAAQPVPGAANNLKQELSPGVFYGSPAGKAAKTQLKLQRLLNQIKHQPVAGQEDQQLQSPSVIWSTFSRQDQAMQFASSHNNTNVFVFVFQDHISGQRRFLATTIQEFWQRYEKMQPALRHHYELLREGSPCHLYFDLEFNRRVNPGANGESMVDLLLSVVADALYDVYSLRYEPGWTVELDSSTKEKFSRHLIIRAPKVVFKDNSHAGAFVGEVCSRIQRLRETTSLYESLFVLKGDTRADHHAEIFVDKAVYSRNRSFRLPFSSKAGKTVVLESTDRFRCAGMSRREVFMDSLICRVDEDCQRFLTFGLEVAGRGGTMDFASHEMQAVSRNPKNGAFHISGNSPFPGLDKFIEGVATVEMIPGIIRSWYWFSDYGVIVYNISGNRFCENIGRQHKSNNVMYIVDFRVPGYYQKCHDPDCRDFRSQIRQIPMDFIPQQYQRSTSITCCARVAEVDSVSNHGVFAQQGSAHQIESCVKDAVDDDELWWNDVISSMASIECESQPTSEQVQSTSEQVQSTSVQVQSTSEQVQSTSEQEENPYDESWWSEVAKLAEQLEAKHVRAQGS